MAGNKDKNKLKEIEFARVVRLSLRISLTKKASTSYKERPEKPGGLYTLDQPVTF